MAKPKELPGAVIGSGEPKNRKSKLPFRGFFSVLKQRFSQLTRHTQIILVIICCVLLVSIGLGIYTVVHKPPKKADSTVSQPNKNTITQSYNVINNQDYKGAIQSLTQVLPQLPPNSIEKYNALINLGSAYLADKQPDKALASFLAAEDIKHDETASTIFVYMAILYAQKGDKHSAATYYRKAIARVKATPETADDAYITQYQDGIKNLGETP